MNREKTWRAKLIEAYPRLFHPPAGGPASAPGYPECDAGWEDLIHCACGRIEKALGESDRF
jgi:hypothetical protein